MRELPLSRYDEKGRNINVMTTLFIEGSGGPEIEKIKI